MLHACQPSQQVSVSRVLVAEVEHLLAGHVLETPSLDLFGRSVERVLSWDDRAIESVAPGILPAVVPHEESSAADGQESSAEGDAVALEVPRSGVRRVDVGRDETC